MPLVNNSLGKIFTNNKSSPVPTDMSPHIHWSARVKETTVAASASAPYLELPVTGGSDYGQFCLIAPLHSTEISYWNGPQLQEGDVILEVQGYEVSGFTLLDLQKLIQLLSGNSEPVVLKTLTPNLLPCPADSLKTFLAMSFPQDSPDYALQNVIKNNLNRRVVPCTTRKKRPDEVDGVDYQFLSPEEFQRRENAGLLLETGLYEGNRYGTPMPSHESSVIPSPQQAHEVSALNGLLSTVPDPNPHLGPLPPHWEVAYTEDAQAYFINHALGTTQWEDPRALRGGVPSTDAEGGNGNGDCGGGVPGEQEGEDDYLVAAGNRQECNIPDGSSEEELPPGWERVEDPRYGVFYIDHIHQHTQYERPTLANISSNVTNQILNTSSISPTGNGNNGENQLHYPHFTDNPQALRGRLVKTTLLKSPRGFGFTIIGGSDRNCPQFLQIKHIVPDGPAAQDGVLTCGDVLVYVNDVCVLGYTHSDVVTLFQQIAVGDAVLLTASQGYRLPYEPDDPDMQFVTTLAVQSPHNLTSNNNNNNSIELTTENGVRKVSKSGENETRDVVDMVGVSVSGVGVGQLHQSASSSPLMITTMNEAAATSSVSSECSANAAAAAVGRSTVNNNISTGGHSANYFMPREQKLEFLKVNILKSVTGFGFTIADHLQGQRVKQILDAQRCAQLRQGDVLVEINDRRVKELQHSLVVQILKECPVNVEARLLIQRGGASFGFPQPLASATGYFGSDRVGLDEMGASFYAMSMNGIAPSALTVEAVSSHTTLNSALLPQSKSMEWLQQRGAETLLQSTQPSGIAADDSPSPELYVSRSNIQRYRSKTPGPDWGRSDGLLDDALVGQSSTLRVSTTTQPTNNSTDWLRPKTPTAAQMRTLQSDNTDNSALAAAAYLAPEVGSGTTGIPDFLPASVWLQQKSLSPHLQGYGSLPRMTNGGRQRSSANANTQSSLATRGVPGVNNNTTSRSRSIPNAEDGVGGLNNSVDFTVTLQRMTTGFGFRILGGAEERSQVTVGPLVPGGAAERNGQMRQGDQIISVDGTSVLGSPHRHVVGLMELAGRVGRVTLGLRRRLGLQISNAAPTPTSASQALSSSLSMYQFVSQASPAPLYAAVSHRPPPHPQPPALPPQRVVSRQLQPASSASPYSPPAPNQLPPVFDVTLHRDPNEGFGFIIATSSNNGKTVTVSNGGEYIARILDGSPAARCGVLRVRDRILAVNHLDISRVQHEEVVRMIKECGLTLTLRVASSLHQQSSAASSRQLPPDSVSAAPGEEFAVTLSRGSRGFGFSIRGGQEFNKMPLCVLKIAEDGAAKQDGRLKVGDQILQINGHPTKGMSHTKAIEIIQSGGSTIRLLVRRPPAANLYQHHRQGSGPTNRNAPPPLPQPVSSSGTVNNPPNSIYYSMQRPR